MRERRKFVRFKAPFCVQYKGQALSQEYSGVLRDISMVGARVLLDASADIDSGSQLYLSIILPGNTLRISGKVAWTKDSDKRKEIGIFFVNISDSYKQNIYNCIFKYYKDEIVQRWWKL